MDQRNDIDLRGAIPETPEMCRDAVLQAVSTYREERYMRKPYKVVLMAAVIVMLLCSTAFALVHFYSVRDYVADGKTSEAFDATVVPLEKTVTTNGMTFTLGDAVFDGTDLAFTMNLAAAENAAPMYFYPSLSATADGKELDVESLGFDMAYDRGFLMPSTDERYALPEHCGIEAELLDNDVRGDITWRYTLQVFKPLAPLVNAREWNGDPDSESHDEWEDYLRGVKAEGKIAVSYGLGIGDYLNAVEPRNGSDRKFDQRILDSGMFELVDTVVFEFTTPMPVERKINSGDTFSFDGYTVTVKTISESFRQVHYTLEIHFDEPQENEHYLEHFYALSDQNGQQMARRGTTLTLSEDHLVAIVDGSAERISDEPLTAITFTLDHNMTIDQNDTAEDMPTFTVPLEK